MFGLTLLGTIHTLISLVALAAGFACLARDGRIEAGKGLARVYIWATVATCVTGFGIFQHGGFGPPHALGVITLLVLAFAAWPGGARVLGARWRYLVTVTYSFTLFLHMIPGVTETFTRLPAGRPLFTGPEDPALQPVAGVLFFVFLAGAVWQVVQMRRADRATASLAPLPGASSNPS
jgi:hypothetical protein